jgi:hypothetical protein
MAKITTQVNPQTLVGTRFTIQPGARITENGKTSKLSETRTVTVADATLTKAGNLKVVWRGHRGMKSAVL